tara:strand:- start:538 stop:828 length:291 start_codon:yes stop_codon:yes gene_type:complete
MRTSTWTIFIYNDNERTDKIYEKEFKNVKEILEDTELIKLIIDFKLSSSMLYECIRPNRMTATSKKKNCLKKYAKFQVKKILHNKKTDEVESWFNK